MHRGTNLVASCNNWWLNNDASSMIAARVIRVELIIIKNIALLEDSPDYHLFIYFPSIKARACSRMYFSFGYFWSLTFPGEDLEE